MKTLTTTTSTTTTTITDSFFYRTRLARPVRVAQMDLLSSLSGELEAEMSVQLSLLTTKIIKGDILRSPEWVQKKINKIMNLKNK